MSTADDSYMPLGGSQTFNVPVGAQKVLPGIGADISLADNQNAAGLRTAYKVGDFSNAATPPTVPEPAPFRCTADR